VRHPAPPTERTKDIRVKQPIARLSLLSLAIGLTACTTTFQESKID
jgi:outer membrane protein assembly factor BamC